jgi:fucose 4-O-acetylase-like acetyltransferase
VNFIERVMDPVAAGFDFHLYAFALLSGWIFQSQYNPKTP